MEIHLFFVALAGGNTEPTIEIKLEDGKYNALVDSGASLSFINAKNIPKDCETFEYVGNKIFDLSGDIKVLGFIRPHLKLTKNVAFVQTLIVLDDSHKIPRHIILGTDFLKKVEGKINFKLDILSGSFRQKPFHKSFIRTVPREDRIATAMCFHIKDDIDIPGSSEVKIPCYVKGNGHFQISDFSANEFIQIAKNRVTVKDNYTEIWLLNTSRKTIGLEATL